MVSPIWSWCHFRMVPLDGEADVTFEWCPHDEGFEFIFEWWPPIGKLNAIMETLVASFSPGTKNIDT